MNLIVTTPCGEELRFGTVYDWEPINTCAGFTEIMLLFTEEKHCAIVKHAFDFFSIGNHIGTDNDNLIIPKPKKFRYNTKKDILILNYKNNSTWNR